MRIAYVVADGGVPVCGDKGASVHVREMVTALGREHEVDLYCASTGDGTYSLPVRRLLVGQAVVTEDRQDPTYRDRRRIAMAASLRQLVIQGARERGYDLIYERYSLFSDVGSEVSTASGVPLLLEVNAPLIEERRRVEALPLSGLAREIQSRVFRQADAVLAVSEAMASYVIANGGSAARVHVVPNGVDTERFHPAVDGTDVRAKLDAGSGLVIGFVGSLKTWHGVDILLEAFRRVASHDWHLMIVGEGPERAALEAQAQGHSGPGRVHFTGAVPHDQIPRYVAAMDIAVAPYRAVPDFYFSPLKLYEYLAAGKPVVASNIGQIASVVRHGYNGYLVEPGEAPALSHALEELAGDVRLRAQLSRNAPQGLVTWEATARRVLALAAGAAAEGVRP